MVCADGDDLVLDGLYRPAPGGQPPDPARLPGPVRPLTQSRLAPRARRLLRRACPDAVLALALLHHLAITGNVPLAELVDWPTPGGRLAVEFVDPADPMADRLLANKPSGMHGDYRREVFERFLEARFDIADREEYLRAPAPSTTPPRAASPPRGTILPRGCSSSVRASDS